MSLRDEAGAATLVFITMADFILNCATRVLICIAWVPFLTGLAACSSASKGAPGPTVRQVRRLVLSNLQSRRTPHPSADPKATPGGWDYTSHPLPNSRFDCDPMENLFRGINLSKVRQCLQELDLPDPVYYHLKLGPQPVLSLDPEHQPREDNQDPKAVCLWMELREIPVPREIIFQGREEEEIPDRLSCYSSRIEVEAGTVLGFELSLSQTRMKLSFPMESPPVTDEQTLLLLQSWALAPFFDQQKGTFPAKVVPDSLCARCVGERGLIQPGSPPAVFWPD